MKRITNRVIALFLVLFISTNSFADSPKRDYQLGKSMELLLNVFREANIYYVDSVNMERMLQNAIKGMLSELDPYTEYIPEEEVSDFETMTTGKYGGMGALIVQKGDWVEISEPYKGTPSDRAGIKAGDRILAIDGVDMKGKGSEKVSSLLRGEPGSKFVLKLRPISDTMSVREVEIVRERIVQPSVPYYGFLESGIGYIVLETFTDGCAGDVKNALADLDKDGELKGVILDLRGNSGGIVDEAIKIASFFLPKGELIVSLRGKIKEMDKDFHTTMDPIYPDMPLMILQSSVSASASEILAGAMQDLDRAVIVGQRSFGKGLVQSPRPVGYDSYLKVTIAKYYIPSGRSVQALDYTHRKEDGSVGNIPDSLITECNTRAGRKVYNGGGVQPDIIVERELLSKFPTILMAYGFIDDFANLYAAYNPAVSVDEFEVTDRIYDQFIDFMQDKEIQYESLTSIKLKELRTWAEREKYDDQLQEEFDAIESKITEDKRRELIIFAGEIKELLGQSIATRWHYAAGGIQYALKCEDIGIEKALEILADPEEYARILREQDTVRKEELTLSEILEKIEE